MRNISLRACNRCCNADALPSELSMFKFKIAPTSLNHITQLLCNNRPFFRPTPDFDFRLLGLVPRDSSASSLEFCPSRLQFQTLWLHCLKMGSCGKGFSRSCELNILTQMALQSIGTPISQKNTPITPITGANH